MATAAKAQNGFTLIEMAAVVALVGIITGGLILGIPQYVQYRQTQTTRAHMDLAMNALSVYSQRYLRLPCPADTVDTTLASGARVGRGTERDGGYCYKNISNRSLYDQTEGVLPWKTLGLSERDVMDGWGRYITYKPAPHLTVQTAAPEMQTGASGQDIHNACRTRGWFDDAGLQHTDRQKALFCCNSAPKQTYLGSAIPSDYDSDISPADAEDLAARLNAIVPAAGVDSDAIAANDPIVSTNRWIDDYSARTSPAAGGDYFLAGSFSQPFDTDADAPLLRASGHAVTLISHGGNGVFSSLRKQTARLDSDMDAAGTPESPDAATDERHNIWPPETFAASLFHPKASNGVYDKGSLIRGASDDVIAWARSDQLFARAGDATCTRPPVVLANTQRNCSNYGNFIYVLDNSGSMTRRYEGYSSRIDVAKDVLPDVIALHIREESQDSKPDEIGFTRLTLNSDGTTLRELTAESVILNSNYTLDSEENINQAISTAEADVDATKASGGTSLFDTILQSAEIANDPARQESNSGERTGLLVVSDGYDNASNMGTNCREDGDYWCDESDAAHQKAADKTLMLRTINANYFPIDINVIKAQPDYDSLTREELFGQVLRDQYPNMDLHIVDMSVTAGSESLSDLRAMVAKVGGGSTFNIASDTQSLRNALMSACRSVTTVSAQ